MLPAFHCAAFSHPPLSDAMSGSGRVLCRIGGSAARAALSLGSCPSTRLSRGATPGAAAAAVRRALSVEANKGPEDLNDIWLEGLLSRSASASLRELHELRWQSIKMEMKFNDMVAAHRYAMFQATEAAKETIQKAFVVTAGGFLIGSLLILDGR